MSEYSSVLRLKLKTTTSGNCRATGIWDLSGGADLMGVNAEDGEAGGETAERRVVVLTGVENLGGGVLTTFALAVSLEMDCDLAGRAIAADADCEDGRSICGTLRKIAFTRMRNMDDCQGENAEMPCPTSSFSVIHRVAWEVCCFASLANPVVIGCRHSDVIFQLPATRISISSDHDH